MTAIELKNNLAAAHDAHQSNLNDLMSQRLTQPNGDKRHLFDPNEAAGLWTAEWWGLANCPIFQQLSTDKQQQIISGCNRGILNESYFIEKSGLAYTAKMILLADNTDVAQLYALIAADEARHLAWIEPYVVPEDKTRPGGAFLDFLSMQIETLPPRLLVFLVQIILEGWGMDHYHRLAKGCQSQSLSAVLLSIVKDEALHHKSGTVLFEGRKLPVEDFTLIESALKTYAEMVRVGPVYAVSIAEQTAGGLSLQEIESVFLALRHSEESNRKIKLLKSLMLQLGVEALVQQLDEQGYFLALSPTEAARAYHASR